MPRRTKTVPTRKRSTERASIFLRSAKSLGRIIGSLQRELDGGEKTARNAAGKANAKATARPNVKANSRPTASARPVTKPASSKTGSRTSTRPKNKRRA